MREINNSNSSAKGFLIGVIAGGVAGGLTALLYAPKSGKELRRDIGRKKDKLVKDVDRYYDDTRKRLDNMIEEGKKKAESLLNDAKSKADGLANGAGNLYKQGMDFISDETTRIKGAVKAGVDAFNDERNSKTRVK